MSQQDLKVECVGFFGFFLWGVVMSVVVRFFFLTQIPKVQVTKENKFPEMLIIPVTTQIICSHKSSVLI